MLGGGLYSILPRSAIQQCLAFCRHGNHALKYDERKQGFFRQIHPTHAQANKHLLFLFIFIKNISTCLRGHLLSWNFFKDQNDFRQIFERLNSLPCPSQNIFNKSIESLGCTGLKKLKYKHNQATHIFIETF